MNVYLIWFMRVAFQFYCLREHQQKIFLFFNGLMPLKEGGGSKSADKKTRKKENLTLIETLINQLKSYKNFQINSLWGFLFQTCVTKIIRKCQQPSLWLNLMYWNWKTTSQNHMSWCKKVPQELRSEKNIK